MNFRGKYGWMVSRKALRLFGQKPAAIFTAPRAIGQWNHRRRRPPQLAASFISPSPSAFGVPTANLGVADELSAYEISRSPEARCGGPVLVEARERSLIASPTFLSVLAVSPPSFP